MDAYLAAFDGLVGDGGEGNFAVFEDLESGRYVQAASARGEGSVLLDVPTVPQDLGAEAAETLDDLGFERTTSTWFEVDRGALSQADPEATAVLHEWIAAGRDPEDDRVTRLETLGLVERRDGLERETFQMALPPERAAYVADRVFRKALGAGADHDVRVEIHLEGEGSDVRRVGD